MAQYTRFCARLPPGPPRSPQCKEVGEAELQYVGADRSHLLRQARSDRERTPVGKFIADVARLDEVAQRAYRAPPSWQTTNRFSIPARRARAHAQTQHRMSGRDERSGIQRAAVSLGPPLLIRGTLRRALPVAVPPLRHICAYLSPAS